jgi:hypothetical protein
MVLSQYGCCARRLHVGISSACCLPYADCFDPLQTPLLLLSFLGGAWRTLLVSQWGWHPSVCRARGATGRAALVTASHLATGLRRRCAGGLGTGTDGTGLLRSVLCQLDCHARMPAAVRLAVGSHHETGSWSAPMLLTLFGRLLKHNILLCAGPWYVL